MNEYLTYIMLELIIHRSVQNILEMASKFVEMFKFITLARAGIRILQSLFHN